MIGLLARALGSWRAWISLGIAGLLAWTHFTAFTLGRTAEAADWHEVAEARRAQVAQAMRESEAHARQLERELLSTLDDLDAANRKTRDALASAASPSRACLSARAVGLLNAGTRGGGGDAAPAGGSAAPGAADPAADSGGYSPAPEAAASELLIAGWIVDAIQQYGTCAARLNTLVDWHEAQRPAAGPAPVEPVR